jgi:ubiquinone/menaquinone biosynthesis C-methylase UbiE
MTRLDPWDAAAQARVSDRWAAASAEWNTAITQALLTPTGLSPDSMVLDLAAGSGEPALSIARRLTAGKVIAIDSSLASLLLAKTHARELGLESKVECLQGDAQAIPIRHDCVDRITCRFGIMFMSNTARAMSEMMRVLKPGGRVALLAWGALEQPFFDATLGVVLRLVPGARIPSEAETMFRFATPGSLLQELRAAGFSDLHEKSLTLPRIWAGTPLELWIYQQEISTLCHPLFASVPQGMKDEIDFEVRAALSRFTDGEVLNVPVHVKIAVGAK